MDTFRYLLDEVHPSVQDQAVEFWLKEAALAPDQAKQRVQQLAAIATDDRNDITAVATMFLTEPAELKQRLYRYRTFVGKDHRRQRLATDLLNFTFEHTEARVTDPSAAKSLGIFLVVDRHLVSDLPPQLLWPKTQFSFFGRRPGGEHLRVRYFDQVKLKQVW